MRKIILILFICSSFAFNQTQTWFPKDLNIQPFTANFIEPKAGFDFFTNKSNLRLDIGTSKDLYSYANKDYVISAGGDLFTYTRLRSTKEFKFPVEAVDYLFGINIGFKKFLNTNEEAGFRFRLSHISAHLVDGRYDSIAHTWMNGRKPRVYSREFLELIPYYRYQGLRLYAGATYLFHVIPDYIGKGIYQAGFDYYYVNNCLPFSPFAAYDFKLSKINKYTSNHVISLGIKFGEFDKKGLSLKYSYYAGYSVQGELFDIRENYSAIGFNLDF